MVLIDASEKLDSCWETINVKFFEFEPVGESALFEFAMDDHIIRSSLILINIRLGSTSLAMNLVYFLHEVVYKGFATFVKGLVELNSSDEVVHFLTSVEVLGLLRDVKAWVLFCERGIVEVGFGDFAKVL